MSKHIPKGHVEISKADLDKLIDRMKALDTSYWHGHTIYWQITDTYIIYNHYVHYNHGVPSAWEYYNKLTGERHYTMKG